MLVGAYPFEDPDDPRNFRKTIGVSDSCTSQTTISVSSLCEQSRIKMKILYIHIAILLWSYNLNVMAYGRGYLVFTTHFQTMSAFPWNVDISYLGFLWQIQKR